MGIGIMNKVFWHFIGFIFLSVLGVECKALARPTWASNIHILTKQLDKMNPQSRFILERNLAKLFQTAIHELDEFLPLSIKKKLTLQKLIIQVHFNEEEHGLFIGGKKRSKILFNISSLLQNDGKSLFFHEFFHFIHHLYRPHEEAWLKEGMARLFEYYLTNRVHWKSIQAFSKSHSRPLVVSYDPFNINLTDYGQSFLFLYYLQEKCGKAPLFWKLTQSMKNQTGAELVHILIKKYRICQGFHQIYRDFMIARAHNQISFTPGQKLTSHYQLFPTTSSLMPIFSLKEEGLLEKLNALHQGTALLVKSSNTQKTRGLPPHFEILFLEKSFPFKVMNKRPEDIYNFYTLFLYPY